MRKRVSFLFFLLIFSLLACDDSTGDSNEMGGQTAGSVGGQMGGNMGGQMGGSMAGGNQMQEVKPMARFELSENPIDTRLGYVPFPSEIYRNEQGEIDLAPAFGNPTAIFGNLLKDLKAETKGFGTSSSLYLSFDGELDQSLLPQNGGEALLDQASLSIIDIDPSSSEFGRRYPLQWRYETEATKYLPAHSLSIRLLEGINLKSTTLYALVVSDKIAKANPDFEAMLLDQMPTEARLQKVYAQYEPLRSFIKAQSNRLPKLSNASVFKTQDAVSEMFKARDYLHTLDRPVARSITSTGIKDSRADFELFNGRYTAPKFQEGMIPYQTEGGAMRFDANGHPIVQGEEDLRFSIAVPVETLDASGQANPTEMPENGWPLVIYAHGTGGNYQSFFREGIAETLVKYGMAVISIDQIHHGERDGGVCDTGDYSACVSLLFFNFLVPLAGRDNVRQSALDLVSLMRMAQGLEIPADLSRAQRAVKIDPTKIAFMGHSQGGLNGPIFLAIEKEVKAGMLSGAGSNIAISIEQKTKPIDINRIVKLALGLPPAETLDRWHPGLAVLQMFIDVGDGGNFGPFWFDQPRDEYAPKSIFMTAGLQDDYTPPDAIFALAVSGRVPLIYMPVLEIEALSFLNIPNTARPPFQGNVANGKATAGIAQYPDEGHYVIFNSPSAKDRYAKFLRDVMKLNVPKIY